MSNTEAFEAMCYGPIGKAVKAVEPQTEADPIGVLASVLAMYSAALNGTVRLSDGKPVAVWTVLAGRSSIGRKGTALKAARGILEPAIGGFLDSRTEGGISSGPSLTQKLYEKEEDTAGTEGGLDGRVLIIDEEWSENLKRVRRCPTFSTKLRACWDGTTIRHTTKQESMVVERPVLGFHTHITPGEWSKYVGAVDALGGSFNRLLPVVVERSKMLPWDHTPVFPETPELREAYDWARKTERTMTLNKEAGKRWDEIRAAIEDRISSMSESLSCYVERSAEQVLRVAAVLTAAQMKISINRKAVDAAWAFVQYSMRSVEKLVRDAAQPTGSNKPIKTLPEMIREILNRYQGADCTSTLMLRSLGSRATAATLKLAVESMNDVECVKAESETGRGRRPVVYRYVVQEETATEEPEAVPDVPPTSVPRVVIPAPVQAPAVPANPLLALL
ncbi:DUF3987 domain-containing protein [Streptomyces sp. NBC_01197]|uniref:DUF3987 domain-containing protein n=1 Tax=Streptomyces sp. NBC_01197 TaxID=2903768 RepID=UPI002E160A90|nr:YfjI family protein [Streptomyces sp. NBC_01197]